MMINCRQAAEQLSENLDEPMVGFARLKLKLHLLLCKYCRNYGKQMLITTQTIKLHHSKAQPSQQLTQALVENYQQYLAKKGDGRSV